MSVAMLNLGIGLLNLIPFRASRTPLGLPTDGQRLLAIPFWGRRQVDEVRATAGLTSVLDAADAGDLPAATLLATQLQSHHPEQGAAAMAPGAVLYRTGQLEAARTRWLQDLSRSSESASPLLKNAVAFVDAILGSQRGPERS